MKNGPVKKLRNTAFVAALKTLIYILRLLPLTAGRLFGKIVALLIYIFDIKDKKIAMRNLDYVYGDKMTLSEKKKLIFNNFMNYGICFFEFVKFGNFTPKQILGMVKEVEGKEYFDVSKKGEGIVAVTAHVGNWELLSLWTAAAGYMAGAIAKRMFDPRVDEIVNGSRKRLGGKIFYNDGINREMLKDLKAGMVLGILADQDTNVDSVFVPFLGHPAKTPVAPAVLAKKLKLKILTVFIYRRPDGFYNIKINKPYDIEGKTEEQIAEMYNNDISEIIRRHPEQWVWPHRRFRMTLEKDDGI